MLRLRQIAFVTHDLAGGERALVDALGVERCHRDPNVIVFGLENALFPVGDQFLEIVSPVRPDTTAGRLLDRRGGSAGYMALFQVDDLAPVEQRLATLGVRVIFDAAGDGIRGLHLHPKDVPGAIVSIDAATEPADWPWAGDAWRQHVRLERVQGICGMTVSVPDPEATCRAWSQVLGVMPEDLQLRVDDAVVRFRRPGGDRREGITGLELATSDLELVGTSVDLLGVTIRFVNPATEPSRFVDSDSEEVGRFVERALAGTGVDRHDQRAVAVALFRAVRDGIRYDPYQLSRNPADYRASAIARSSSNWCVPKAVLYTAALRHVGIPARLGFADVRNHLTSAKLSATMGTDVFAWHGYTELLLDGRWLKASTAFNIELCERFGTKVLDFDGEHDALLHPYDEQGNRHMEYVRQRGTYDDLPLAEIFATFGEVYGWSMDDANSSDGDHPDPAFAPH